MVFTIRFVQSEGSFRIYKNDVPLLRAHLGLANGSDSTFTWVEVAEFLHKVVHSATNEKNELEVSVG
jgi:hypothetical protein